MHVAIVHDTVSESDTPDARDVLAQADAVAEALARLGHSVCRIACSLDLGSVVGAIESSGADLVFNLVESVGGQGRLIHLCPYTLDAMPIAYTGAPARAMLLTSDKTLAKRWMTAAGIATPAWIDPLAGSGGKVLAGIAETRTWIVKSVWEHASIGLGPESIIENADAAAIRSILADTTAAMGGDWFAEAFIDGREFNLSILAGPRGPEVLPPAEIIFDGYTQSMPRIVDYRAKWDETSYEYHHTPRRFDFDPADEDLLQRLRAMALACWRVFGLAGYARVDFRITADGCPFVLEVNANPCIAPDAGFAAALAHTGIQFEEAVARIITDIHH